MPDFTMPDFAAARANMIEGQIRTNDVTDKAVLAAMAATARERFVPAAKHALAYSDADLPIFTADDGTKRTLMEPRVFARLVQLAEINPTDLVLYVGAGLGYGSAVVAQLAETVVALESEPTLVATASDNLAAAGADNVAVIEAALPGGCPSQAPFDVIIIEGAVPAAPRTLCEQLADGGRLVCVVGRGLAGKAHIFERTGDHIGSRAEFSAAVSPLPEFATPVEFVF